MTLSTSRKFTSVSSSQSDRVNSLSYFDRNTLEVCVSEAEAQVIMSKARKAGLSVNEYMRHAALGFPMP